MKNTDILYTRFPAAAREDPYLPCQNNRLNFVEKNNKIRKATPFV